MLKRSQKVDKSWEEEYYILVVQLESCGGADIESVEENTQNSTTRIRVLMEGGIKD